MTLKITADRNGNYTETTVESFNTKIMTGLCDDAEAYQIYKELINTAYELSRYHDFEKERKLLVPVIDALE